MLEVRLLHRSGTHGLLQLIETNFFANVELNQDKHRASEAGSSARSETAVLVADWLMGVETPWEYA
jgi:hypothetical protein